MISPSQKKGTQYQSFLRSDCGCADINWEDLPPPDARFREFLTCVASLSATSKIEKDRETLAPELVAQLSNADVELVAEAYAASSALQTVRSGGPGRNRTTDTRIFNP